MKCTAILFVISFVAATGLPMDLAQFAKMDPRLEVLPINKPYDQILGYQSQIVKWDSDFKARYGPGWNIIIDLRGGRPGHVSGQGIPTIPGIGNQPPYDHEIGEEDVKLLAASSFQEHGSREDPRVRIFPIR